jgi:TetR/AcrR family transcriptional regulator, regulator of autoinduction and epiphytic fitness
MAENERDQGGGLAGYRRRIMAEKRSAILDGAAETFLDVGYDRATLEAIARRANVSTGTLFKYFPTKAALFGAIMAQVWEIEGGDTPIQPGASAADLATCLRAIGHDYARLLRAPTVEGLFRVIVAEGRRFPELGLELYERGKKPWLDRLHDELAKRVAKGQARIDDVPLAARQFLGMINDVIFWPRLLIADLTVDDGEVERVVEAAVATFLARYGAKGRKSW